MGNSPRRSSFVWKIALAIAVGAGLGQIHRTLDDSNLADLARQWAGEGMGGSLLLVVLSAVAAVAQLSGPLGELGSLVVNLIKGLAGPYLFLAVVQAFLRTQVRWRGGAMMVGISLINAALAILIGLSLSNWLQPGRHFASASAGTITADMTTNAAGSAVMKAARPIDFIKDLLGFVPTSIVQPFLDNSILSIVMIAVLAGLALRRVKVRQAAAGDTSFRALEDALDSLCEAVEIILGWVIALVPVAVFGVVAATVSRSGFRPFLGLVSYVGVAVLGLVLHVAIVYQSWILFVARRSLRWFWSGARDAVAYALGASSSLATLPVTLRCLDRMGVRPAAARLAACVGTNLNNDGILLYEAMAVLFVAQAYGYDLTLSQQLIAAISCLVAGIGIAGIPEAGLISLALVLSTVGLPVGLLPLLLTVDWFLSRCRAATNVVSDMVVATVLDRWGVGTGEPEGEASGAARRLGE